MIFINYNIIRNEDITIWTSYHLANINYYFNLFKVSDRQRVSNWDILEGMKNPAPLSWSWFGAVRLERRPLACEDTHRLLKYHTHNLTKPPSYYLDPPPLPPEDLEPLPDKPVCICFLFKYFIQVAIIQLIFTFAHFSIKF